ncbi:MAG TPA: hypothetical protein VF658_21020 [Pyrinomonadaceae bacterium]|jgi:hypothetical protein
MKFNFTPDEAQIVAKAVARYLKRKRMSVSVEVAAWQDAPLRTTLVGKLAGLVTLIEVQGALNYNKPIKDLATWIAAKRYYAELSIAVPSEATTQAGVLDDLREDGIGLLIVEEEGPIKQLIKPKNPSLVIMPDPTLKFGKCKQEVLDAVTKFNDVDRKDGLRDMCELVERETEVLAVSSVRKGILVMSENDIKRQDWSTQIDTLASARAYSSGHQPIIETKLKADMHSFRGARNLVDHKVRTKRDDKRRQMQFAERMMQGPRLIAEIMTLQRRIK